MRPIYNMINDRYPMDSMEALRMQLLLSSGTYCSFCEIPLGGEIYVAQRVSASGDVVEFRPPGGTPFKWYLGQPWAALTFRNSFLSCRNCKDLRGQFPSNYEALEVLSVEDPDMVQAVIASMTQGAQALPPDQLEAIYSAAAKSMLWPDTSLNADGEVLFQGTITEPTFTFETSVSSQVQLAERDLVRLSADEAQQLWANTPTPGLWVIPSPNIVDPAKRLLAYTTVQMNYLNSFNPARWPLDNRVWMRTQALHTIQASWSRLDGVLGRALQFFQNVPNVLELLLSAPSVREAAQLIRQEVKTTGFWSVWFTFFGEKMKTEEPWTRLTDKQRELVLYSLFIQYEPEERHAVAEEPKELTTVLPGTDLDRIPLFQQEGRR